MPGHTLHRDLEEAQSGVFRRAFRVDRSAIDKESRTIDMTFSSEEPYKRWWGIEILDHSESSVRLGRLNGGAHPLLVNHDWDRQPGVIEKAWIGDDRRGRSRARFGRSAYADEIRQDVEDGIRSLVSVGYIVHKVIEQSTQKAAQPSDREISGDEFRALVLSDEFQHTMSERREAGEDPPVFRVVDWEPFENSLVAVPADATVGVGRSFTIGAKAQKDTKTMTDENRQPAEQIPDVQAITNAARDSEITRIREIVALGNLHKRPEMAQDAVTKGTSRDQFGSDLLAALAASQPKFDPQIGMTDREVRRFSLVRAIRALANPKDQSAQREAAFEFEASQAQAQKLGKPTRGLMIPEDVLRRDLITGTATSTAKGGNLVQTTLLDGSFIDVLRNKMVLPAAGARFLSGLQGNVAIPKKTTASTSYWVGENSAPTEGAMVFGQVTLSPKTLAAYVDFSRRLAIQSSVDVENMVRDDLATGIAVALDEAGLGGAKTNGPTGVRGTSGIGSAAIGTNGGAPTWASIVSLEREVEVDNALVGSLAYITNAKVRAKLKQTPRQSSGVEGNFLLSDSAKELNGYAFLTTNAIPSNLTKGSSSDCSAMLFGNWSDLLIGQWSGIDLLVDPYTGSSAATTRVTAFVDVDVAVRYAESFAAVLDYRTT